MRKSIRLLSVNNGEVSRARMLAEVNGDEVQQNLKTDQKHFLAAKCSQIRFGHVAQSATDGKEGRETQAGGETGTGS